MIWGAVCLISSLQMLWYLCTLLCSTHIILIPVSGYQITKKTSHKVDPIAPSPSSNSSGILLRSSHRKGYCTCGAGRPRFLFLVVESSKLLSRRELSYGWWSPLWKSSRNHQPKGQCWYLGDHSLRNPSKAEGWGGMRLLEVAQTIWRDKVTMPRQTLLFGGMKTQRDKFWLLVSTHLKNMLVKLGSSSPNSGENKTSLSCHHPEFHFQPNAPTQSAAEVPPIIFCQPTFDTLFVNLWQAPLKDFEGMKSKQSLSDLMKSALETCVLIDTLGLPSTNAILKNFPYFPLKFSALYLEYCHFDWISINKKKSIMISSDPCHEESSNKNPPSLTTPKEKTIRENIFQAHFPIKTYFFLGGTVSPLSRGVFFALIEAEVGSSALKPMDKWW